MSNLNTDNTNSSKINNSELIQKVDMTKMPKGYKPFPISNAAAIYSHSLVDLHIYSKNTSGSTMTVEEIFEEAAKKELQLISITDKNNFEAISKRMDNEGYPKDARIYHTMVNEKDLWVLLGVEIACNYKDKHNITKKINLLAYGFDRSNTEAVNLIHTKELCDSNYFYCCYLEIRNKILTKYPNLKTHKMPKISDCRKYYETVVKNNKNPFKTNKSFIYDFFAENGYSKSLIKCFFPKYKSNKSINIDAKHAISVLNNANAIVMLSNPANIFNSYKKLENLYDDLSSAGIDGREYYCNAKSEKNNNSRLGISSFEIISGGSTSYTTDTIGLYKIGNKNHHISKLQVSDFIFHNVKKEADKHPEFFGDNEDEVKKQVHQAYLRLLQYKKYKTDEMQVSADSYEFEK